MYNYLERYNFNCKKTSSWSYFCRQIQINVSPLQEFQMTEL